MGDAIRPLACEQCPVSGAMTRATTDLLPVTRSSASAAVIARSVAFAPANRNGSLSQRGER